MKVLIPILIGLLVVGCGEVENGAYKHRPKQTDTNESTPTTKTNKVNNTTEKLAKELTLEEKVVGTYEMKGESSTTRLVLMENGIVKEYENGKPEGEARWKIVDKVVHIIGSEDADGATVVLRINPDDSLTVIASIRDGKRKARPKENPTTFKKIK